MKKLFLLLALSVLSTSVYSQIAVTGASSVRKEPITSATSDVITSKDFKSLIKNDELRLFIININEPLGTANPRPFPLVRSTQGNEMVFLNILKTDDIKIDAQLPGMGGIGFSLKKQNFEDYSAYKFKTTTNEVNITVPIILISTKKVIQNQAVRKLLIDTKELDINKFKAALEEQNLSNEDITIIYYINVRKSAE
ncbi:MAG: hypothetical protein R3Y26_04445 [Rikenellaceae bacterium]